ncbi:MAG: ABC transporter ATP-binding protein [Actinomycetota bacterium]|nr:ABC transporter ATP-binding protein [Actinomycetota bacterium]
MSPTNDLAATVKSRAIDVRGLRKSYRDVEAVRGIDLHVDTGEVFALLGPNGAGKTTAVEILEGYRKRDAGDVDVLGHDPQRAERSLKERIGIVLQETSVDHYYTVREVVELYGGYYPNPLPVDEVIEVVGLTEKRDERIKRLSGGQQRRLDVALGLAGDPELLFLDEPTTGFDPGARRNAWEMIRNLQGLGKTILLTTHYMDEAQNLADRVAVLVRGRIVAEGPPGAIGGRDIAGTRISFSLPNDSPPLAPALMESFRPEGDKLVVETDKPTRLLHELTGWALHHRLDLLSLDVSRPTLEDVYLRLAGEDAAAPPAGTGGQEASRRRGR